ncbi:MAG: CARDB domain-containing protein, partial [Pseudomonadota bacterium]
PLLVSPLIQALDVRNERFKDDDIKVNSIAPGEEVRTRIRIGVGRDKSTYRGTRIIRIKADPRGKIAERNELNNTFSVRVKAHHCS